MRTVIIATLTGVLGIAIGATGWALLGPDETSTNNDNRPAAATPARAAHHYKTAQAIADALQAAGLTVSMVHKETDDTYITEVGGTAYDFTVTDKAGKPAADDSGINMFPNAEALKTWTGISESMGGIAVTGDTWAVSLPTTSKTARTNSQHLAPKVAKALSGTVQN